MDFSKNVVLKENYCFLVADSDGQVRGGEDGLYRRDTRFLSRYEWKVDPQVQTLLVTSPRPDRLHTHQALLAHHQQLVAVERRCRLVGGGLSDRLTVTGTSLERQQVTIELALDGDFADLFEVRGWDRLEREIERDRSGKQSRLAYTDADGRTVAVEVNLSEEPEWLEDGTARFVVTLEPGVERTIEVEVSLLGGGDTVQPALDYQAWRDRFRKLPLPGGREAVVQRAVDDLRALLLFTEDGPIAAAGIPWFVAAFGRDALITATMLLPWVPELGRGTLRYLARYQGRQERPFQAEQPGKIMHELRFGELARTGKIPHSPYYGTVDATPLFIVLLGRLHQQVGDLALVQELRPSWEAALTWMVRFGDADGDGFLEFTPAANGLGLGVQSWKDSNDSMSHRDGSLARGRLAVSEVQGYAYEAYLAASRFYSDLGEEPEATRWMSRAEGLRRAFHEAFWLEEIGSYAMALDGEKRPLAVHNSDAGHLLWSGIVPEAFAPRLVETLFSPENWSGWGFRTLGSGEVRYNPVSYHNGSVWPHDSAMIAGGLADYGFGDESATVRRALLDLAQCQPDLRPPELVGGYARVAGSPPVPYPVACRPQAWDAAAVIYLLSLMGT